VSLRWGFLGAAVAAIGAGAYAASRVVRKERVVPESYADARYLLLSTYRKNGTRAQAPVWFVEDDGRIVVTTPVETWKVKRIRRDPRVELQPCDVAGRVASESEVIDGVARVVTGEEADAIRDAIYERYGWQASAIRNMEGLGRRLGRDSGFGGERVGLVITRTERLGARPATDEPGDGG